MTTNVAIILGTRPEIIRFAPIIKDLKKKKDLSLEVIHTGQHYSYELNKIFFDELELPQPEHTLVLQSESPVKQLAEIVSKVSDVYTKLSPRLICVWGDTNSSLGAGIAANKMHLKLMHVEAGCRSNDFNMAEEYNRIVLDHISDKLVPLATHDKQNLETEHVHGEIYLAGDPLYDVFLAKRRNLRLKGLTSLYKKRRHLGILTLHRAENVDAEPVLRNILEKINESLLNNNDCDLIFPIHPRTKKMLEKYNLGNLIDKNYITVVEPLGYDELVELLLGSDFVITDSGGFQKEAFFAKKPCITLRKSTEWVDTVKLKTNILIDPSGIQKLPDIEKFLNITKVMFGNLRSAPYGNGHATEKIVRYIENSI